MKRGDLVALSVQSDVLLMKNEFDDWPQQFSEHAGLAALNSLFVVIEVGDKTVRVLSTDGTVGWIFKLWVEHV